MGFNIPTFGAANKKIESVATGFDHAVSNSNGTITVYFVDGSSVTTDPIKGDKGDTGETGIQGVKGDTGSTGPQGERGVSGVGIVSVTKIGTSGLVDTYKILFSDASETTYEIVNGANVTSTSQLTNDSDFVTSTAINLVNYYLKDEVYNKAKIDELLRNVGVGLSVKIVSELPTTDISGTTIYLINTSGSQYNQYMYIDGDWANLGSTSADLSSYYNKTQIDTMLLGYINASTLITQLMQYTKTSDLSRVATSGSYNDLSDLPVIPSTDGFMKARESLGEVDLNDCVTEGVYTITKTSSNLPDVEIYGTYCDLEVLSIQTVVNQQLRIVVGDDEIPMLWNRSKIGDTWTEWAHALSNEVTTNTIVNDDKLIPSSKAVYDALEEKPEIDDTTSATDKVYSSAKIETDYMKNYTDLADIGITGNTTSVSAIFNAMPNNSKVVVGCGHTADGSVSGGYDITDIPMYGKNSMYGVLEIVKIESSRHSIKFSPSLGGATTPYQTAFGRIKGNDGSGLVWDIVATTDSANPLHISTSATNVLYYALTNIGKASDKTHLMRVTAISSSGSNVALFTYKHTASNTKIVISSNNLTITAQNESGTIAYSSTPTRIIVEYIAQLD